MRLEVHHAVTTIGGKLELGSALRSSRRGRGPRCSGGAGRPPRARRRSRKRRAPVGLAPAAERRVTGFSVRPGADLPVLARAGIQPGDVILSVNGSILNEEQLLELAWTIANSNRTEFEVERGGRRLRLSAQGQ